VELFDAVIGNTAIQGKYSLREGKILDYPWKKTVFTNAAASLRE